jgi:ribosomal protein S18 acetylase RimI-like enzyme
MKITYQIDTPITHEQFIELLKASSLAERRPIEDIQCMKGMVENSNLIVTAWHGSELVGIARSMTDFHYACYLSDLAVHNKYQKQGVGKQLLILTQQQLGEKCNLILVAAPDAHSYYEYIGFTNNPRCWILGRNEEIS